MLINFCLDFLSKIKLSTYNILIIYYICNSACKLYDVREYQYERTCDHNYQSTATNSMQKEAIFCKKMLMDIKLYLFFIFTYISSFYCIPVNTNILSSPV